MKLAGQQMSREARKAINDSVLYWIVAHIEAINDSCLIGELFRSKVQEAVVLRVKLTHYLTEELRVKDKNHPSKCIVRRAEEVDVHGPEWHRLSTTMIAAALGMDHSSIVKRTGKAKS